MVYHLLCPTCKAIIEIETRSDEDYGQDIDICQACGNHFAICCTKQGWCTFKIFMAERIR